MGEIYNLTNPQKSIWNMENYFNETTINNICTPAIIYEKIDIEKMKEAINNSVKENDSFRIKIEFKNGMPVQTISDYEKFDIEVLHVKDEKNLKNIEQEMCNYKFNILNSLLFKFKIVIFENGYGAVILVVNHIIADSWSLGLVVKNVLNEYHNLLDENKNNEKQTYSYIDYIESEENYKKSKRFDLDRQYWADVFKTIPEQTNIPGSKKNSGKIKYDAKRYSIELNFEVSKEIREFCIENKVSTFNFLMAIYAIYIGRVSNLNELVIGTPILNRTSVVQKQTMGLFVNTVPVKIELNDEKKFIEFLRQTSTNMLGILKHQKYSYNQILEDIRKKDTEIPNLYNILISYQITKAFDANYGKYKTEWVFNNYCPDNIDIHITDINDTGKLKISYDYLTDKYTEKDIEDLHERISYIAKQILENENKFLKDIEIVTPEERNVILNNFNNTKVDYNKNKTIVDYFEEQVKRVPNNVAIICNDKTITYEKLNEKANILAHYLIKNGVKQKSNIGIMVHRSIEMIVGLLAILKTGGTYLPIDPQYPEERITYILKNSECKNILVDNDTKDLINDEYNKTNISFGTEIYNSNETKNLNIKILPDDILYMIYTSGSTGNPKGVMITYKNLTNFLLGSKKLIDFSENKVFLSVTTMCFDIFALEIWGSLTSGIKVVIANDDEQVSPNKLKELCEKYNVNMMQTTPSRYLILLTYNDDLSFLNNFTEIMAAGEPFPKKLLDILQKNTKARILNLYGPTETTVWSTFKDLTNSKEITIGKPIMNTTCYILDKNKKLLPINVPGELYIGGEGVTAGYWKQENLKKDRYIKSPFNNEETIYNTKDLAYFNENGDIVHLGRTDFQVKIKGYRVELEEIKNKIVKFNGIKDCVVSAVDNNKRLCAYYTASSEVNQSELRKYLTKLLPNYMVPNYFVKMEEMPYTPNGKIDKKALPEPKISNNNEIYVEPKTKTEIQLASIWEDLFKIKKVGLNSNFFDNGGDSLLAITLSAIIFSKFNVSVSVAEIFDKPQLKELANLIDGKQIEEYNKITPCENKDYYAVSSAQKRIYYASKLDRNNSISYNIPNVIIFNKKPDITKLNECFKQIIQRHPSLRTSFEIVDEDVKQKVANDVEFKIEIQKTDLTDIDEISKKFVKPFDLSKAPLLRATFIETNNQNLLLVDMHHIISDGLSLSILDDELCKLYNGEELEPLKLKYIDYAEWENKNIKENKFENSKKFWLEEFKNNIPILDLPTDFSRPAAQDFEGDKIHYTISKELTNKINEMSKKLDVSNFMILLSCYYILLSKYTMQEDIVVGTPVIGRNKAELLNIVGMFVNSLPIKEHIDSSISFVEFLNNVKQKSFDAIKNSEYPFDQLVKDLELKRDASRNPLFDTLFTYQNNKIPEMKFDGEKARFYAPNIGISKFDLSIEILPLNNELNLSFEYATKLFKKDTIERLAEHFVNIIKNVIENNDIKISDIELLSEKEKNKILFDFNNTKKDYDRTQTISTLFEKQAAKTPDNIALVCNNQKITYKELNEKANCLAYYLRNTLKVRKNDIIGVMANRSIEVVVSMLAVIKAGGVYIPIDPTFPKERIDYMLEISKAKVVLTLEKLKNKINYNSKLAVDLKDNEIYKLPNKNLKCINNENDLVYLIFTSGSTGKPKGVMVTHRVLSNFTNFCNNYVEYLKNPKYLTFVSITTISFDLFAYETLISLQKGLKVVIANENEQTTPSLLNKLMEKNNVDIIQSTPSVMQIFLNNKDEMPALKNIKYAIFAGEQLPLELVKTMHSLNNMTIYNGYGPSETYYCSYAKMDEDIITIGKPIYNSQMYILDQNMKPVPIGVPGDIYISGDCVGNGYLNNKELTDKNFIQNPFLPGVRMYRCGDIGKYLPDGRIICLGRADRQVKIRGLRIELGEIESLLSKYPNITKVTVAKQKIKNREFIVAYYVSEKRIATNELRGYLSKYLPKYMLPSYYISLDDMPYTPNGKIDKKALPLPVKNENVDTENYEAPQTYLQKKLVKIWENILNTEPIGINDNFFELGGDSLLAMSLNLEIAKLSDKVTYQDIFQFPTIAELEKIIENNSKVTLYKKVEDLSPDSMVTLKSNKKFKFAKKYQIKNVILTGSTGFLGIHVLNELLQIKETKVYCIIRNDRGIKAEKKLKQKLNYYFGDKYDDLIGNRIIVVTGDICKPNFGLKNDELKKLINSTDLVINCAANVSHFGKYETFYKTNVQSVKYVIDFCKKNNKKLYHISTMGVAGLALDSTSLSRKKKNNVIFDESSLYIGQRPETVYSYTKFQAEIEVLNEIQKGLDGYIMRMGNLMPRMSDGRFQENVLDNEFLNKIASFIKIGAIPQNLMKYSLEITPVDYAAKAICKIIEHPTEQNRVFHIYDDKKVKMNRCLKTLKFENCDIKVLPEKEFIDKIGNILGDEQMKKKLEYIMNDFDENKHISYEANMNVKSRFTKNYLLRIGFIWPKISNKYLISFFKILRKVI